MWLEQGSLAVAAGPQLYVFDKTLKDMDIRGHLHLDAHNYPLDNVFDVCRRLNGPLPVYHPQFLQQLILSGTSNVCIN
jgi:RAVE protein 1 C terminal